MKTFAARRQQNLICLLLATALLLAWYRAARIALLPTYRLTGWALLAAVFVLAGYQFRKHVPFLPLLSTAAWLRFHVLLGLFSFALFFCHVGFRVPNGWFEGSLAAVYLGTFLSGVGGLALSRIIPRRITGRGEEVIYERIPILIRQLREEVETLVFDCLRETESTAVSEYYLRRLRPFFERPRQFWTHTLHSGRAQREFKIELAAQKRFLSEREQTVIDRIAEKIKRKNDLDYQFAMQTILKFWLFVHVPLTYALLVMSVFHLYAVHAFGGGIW
jgi:hypothetical protein